MSVTKLCQSVRNSSKFWFTSAAIAVSILVAATTISLADQPDRDVVINRSTDGVYLYGESDQPNALGKEYIIFETIGKKTIGAFYLPQSEFSCFYGQFRGARLNVTLIDAYDQQRYNYNLVLNPRGLTTSKLPMMGAPTYQPLAKISDNDRHILNTCKLQLQN
jgi:hypothetical protein